MRNRERTSLGDQAWGMLGFVQTALTAPAWLVLCFAAGAVTAAGLAVEPKKRTKKPTTVQKVADGLEQRDAGAMSLSLLKFSCREHTAD